MRPGDWPCVDAVLAAEGVFHGEASVVELQRREASLVQAHHLPVGQRQRRAVGVVAWTVICRRHCEGCGVKQVICESTKPPIKFSLTAGYRHETSPVNNVHEDSCFSLIRMIWKLNKAHKHFSFRLFEDFPTSLLITPEIRKYFQQQQQHKKKKSILTVFCGIRCSINLAINDIWTVPAVKNLQNIDVNKTAKSGVCKRSGENSVRYFWFSAREMWIKWKY